MCSTEISPLSTEAFHWKLLTIFLRTKTNEKIVCQWLITLPGWPLNCNILVVSPSKEDRLNLPRRFPYNLCVPPIMARTWSMADEPYDEYRDGELRGGYNKNSDQCHNRDKYGHGALSHLTRTVPFEKFEFIPFASGSAGSFVTLRAWRYAYKQRTIDRRMLKGKGG